MERHYTYFMSIFPGGYAAACLEKFFVAVVLGCALILLTRKATAVLAQGSGLQERVIPDARFGLLGFFDVYVEGFLKFHDSILGKERRKYASLAGTVFLFVLLSNLLGVIPGMPAITTTVWVNVGIALVVFFSFNTYGIREHGLGGYLKHFFGGPDLVKFPLVFIGMMIFVLEIISTLLRILTLNLRLFWNITADHIILQIFTDLSFGVPIFFYLMGTFVCFMQAFVFTILTMIYILLATQHEEGHH